MRLVDLSVTMSTMISASGVRIGWADLPAHVRAAVDQILAAPVVHARTQPGGFSPGSADRVLTDNGRRAFVKAAGVEQNEMTIELHRREARVAAGLPATVPAPALLGVHDDGQWIALVFEDVDGRHPATPWVAHEIDAVMAALAQVAAATQVTSRLPTAVDELASDLAGWHRIAADRPADLDPWALSRIDYLCGLSDRALTALQGDHLVHTDIRADNLLVRSDGTVAVVDWPWATRGPVWLDRLLLLVNVNLFGGHDVEKLLTKHVDAGRDDITAVLAGLAGYLLDAARLPPPRGLPTLRGFQAAQGERTLAWLKSAIRPVVPTRAGR
jgi:aminoglycoside phosphotransferase (APT) family kinase protein